MKKLNVCLITKDNSSVKYCNSELIENLLTNGKVAITGYDLFKKLENGTFKHLTFQYSSSYQVHSEEELIQHINLIEGVHSNGHFRISLHANLTARISDTFKILKEFKHILFTQHNLNIFEWEQDEDSIQENIYFYVQEWGSEAAKQMVRQYVNATTTLPYDVDFNIDLSGKSMTELIMPYFKIIPDFESGTSMDLQQKLHASFDIIDEELVLGKPCYICYHGEGEYVFTLHQISSTISGYLGEIEETLQQVGISKAKVIFCVDELH